MRIREAKTGAGAPKRRAPEPADVPQNVYPTKEAALHDLALYLSGQSHQPDADLQLEAIEQDLNNIVDDEVVSSLERTFEMAVFSSQVHTHDQVMDELTPAHELLKKLRELQKTRLRDAISRATHLRFV